MEHFKYLIIGGGMTADAAAKGIREKDNTGSIGIISNEKNPPYNRPPLSKGLWKGDEENSVWRKTDEKDVTVILSREAVSINRERKTVTDNSGSEYSYDKLLLAMGGIVNKLPFQAEGIIYYRTYDDYKNLREKTKDASNIVVIGGGFIGSEIAASLAMNNKNVTMVFPEAAIGARVYPASLASFLNNYYQSKGVSLLSNDGVTAVEKTNGTYMVKSKSGSELKTDIVIAGIGIKPNTKLAEASGIRADNGIVVDEFLRTNDPDIFAAGDIANFFSPTLDKRIRVEHEDNANTMGEIAGKNMAGASEKYEHLPFFYSDLFDLGYEAVGELDTRHEMVEDWKESFKEGVIYYLQDKRVRGVLLWNTWGQVENARELIAEKGEFNENSLKGRLPK